MKYFLPDIYIDDIENEEAEKAKKAKQVLPKIGKNKMAPATVAECFQKRARLIMETDKLVMKNEKIKKEQLEIIAEREKLEKLLKEKQKEFKQTLAVIEGFDKPI